MGTLQYLYSMVHTMVYILGLSILVLPAIGSDYSVECEATLGEWGEWASVAGSRVMQERTTTATEKRTDPKRNIGGQVMNSIRYPDAVKAYFLKKMKGIYCA